MFGRLVRQRSVGIRFTDHGISFVKLESVLRHVRVLDAGVIPLDTEGSPEAGSVPSAGEDRPSGPRWSCSQDDEVILGLPRRDVICRFIDVPNVGEAQLAGLLAFEIERHIPFPLDEAFYSYQKVSSQGATARVLIVAAKRASVEQALARVKRLGIIPTGMDVASMAAATALIYQRGVPAAETATLVQVEDGEAAVDVLSRQAVVSSRIVRLDDKGTVENEGRTIQMESRKPITSPGAALGVGDGAPVNGSMGTAPLVAELKRVAALQDGPAGTILVHGVTDSLSRNLQEELGTSVDRWDTATLAADPAAFGLALRGLPRYALSGNLLPPERRPVRRDRSVLLCRSLLALVACLAAAWWVSDALLQQWALDRLTEDIHQVRQEASAVTALQQEASTLSRRLKALEGLMSVQGRSMHLLREVVMLLPPDVLLQELSFDGNKVRLRGSTTASAALLISVFERSVYLENAAFTAPISVQGKDRQVFEIAATIRAVPQPPAQRPAGGA